ncbi:SRPBCC family protein [Dyadobacter pollutisoli]|uniref:SRPBCC family protein n=1 Tax=Dyadobacter pollutisoli TaxID=2910158 RepID=A0A9E8NBH7_9BACT|nr:SRPBCC family protein [Dyadobacter pollutisoli]WAC13594.1 SRPBCC family protein [Dyadobacter pollutisoli]
MLHRIIDKKLEINALPGQVWKVFTDCEITRQMGGEYVTDWNAGNAFGWKGNDGNMYTNGKILKVVPEKLLRHSLFNGEKPPKEISIITYEFLECGGKTLLAAREEIHHAMTDKQYEEASQGWDYALNAVKDLAEKL